MSIYMMRLSPGEEVSFFGSQKVLFDCVLGEEKEYEEKECEEKEGGKEK